MKKKQKIAKYWRGLSPSPSGLGDTSPASPLVVQPMAPEVFQARGGQGRGGLGPRLPDPQRALGLRRAVAGPWRINNNNNNRYFRNTVPAPNPNSGLAGFLPGSSGAAGPNTNSEIAVQIGMRVGFLALHGAKRCCAAVLPGPPDFEQCLSGLGRSV